MGVWEDRRDSQESTHCDECPDWPYELSCPTTITQGHALTMICVPKPLWHLEIMRIIPSSRTYIEMYENLLNKSLFLILYSTMNNHSRFSSKNHSKAAVNIHPKLTISWGQDPIRRPKLNAYRCTSIICLTWLTTMFASTDIKNVLLFLIHENNVCK